MFVNSTSLSALRTGLSLNFTDFAPYRQLFLHTAHNLRVDRAEFRYELRVRGRLRLEGNRSVPLITYLAPHERVNCVTVSLLPKEEPQPVGNAADSRVITVSCRRCMVAQ